MNPGNQTLIMITGFLIGCGIGQCTAKAADENYCALYAREAVRIDIMHTTDIDKLTADTDYIMMLAERVYNQCLSILPTPLPLPPMHRSMDTWLADMRDLLLAKSLLQGTAPAVEEPREKTLDDATWRRQCAAEYRTWNPDTGTVIRRGVGEVRCPCGDTVVCD